MSKYFEIDTIAVAGPKFAWASGYGPLPQMPFFEKLEVFRERKERYWKVNPEPEGLEVDSGSEWPDLIGSGAPPPKFFVSKRIIDALERAGIGILRKTAMPIGKIRAKRLIASDPPGYFVLEAVPGIEVDFARMGIATDSEGIPMFTPEQRLHPPKLVLRENTWNGLDLFSFANLGGTVTLCCTERVRQLAETERWTNIEFRPIG